VADENELAAFRIQFVADVFRQIGYVKDGLSVKPAMI
jgi:hypothetical protein